MALSEVILNSPYFMQADRNEAEKQLQDGTRQIIIRTTSLGPDYAAISFLRADNGEMQHKLIYAPSRYYDLCQPAYTTEDKKIILQDKVSIATVLNEIQAKVVASDIEELTDT